MFAVPGDDGFEGDFLEEDGTVNDETSKGEGDGAKELTHKEVMRECDAMRECAAGSRGRDNEGDSSSSEVEFPPVHSGKVQQLGKTLPQWSDGDDLDDSGEDESE